MRAEQRVKCVAIYGQHIDPRDRSGRCHTRVVVHQGHLSEACPWPQSPQHLFLALAGLLPNHFDLALDHKEEPIAPVSLAEDNLVWLEMLSGKASRPFGLELDDIARQQ